MCKQYELTPKDCGWAIMARKGTSAAWLCLGGCPSHTTALRVYLALKAGGGR